MRTSFFAQNGVEGRTAETECCACGKSGPGYKALVRQHGLVAVDPVDAVELMCRPSKAMGVVEDGGECNFPFTNVSVAMPNEYVRVYAYPPLPNITNFSNVPTHLQPFVDVQVVNVHDHVHDQLVATNVSSFNASRYFTSLEPTLPYNISIVENYAERCCLDPASGIVFLTVTDPKP